MTCLLAEWEPPKKPGQHGSQTVHHQACGLFLVEEVQGRMDATSCHPLDSTFEVVFIYVFTRSNCLEPFTELEKHFGLMKQVQPTLRLGSKGGTNRGSGDDFYQIAYS